MPLFKVSTKSTKSNDKNLLVRVNNKSSSLPTIKGGGTLLERISNIKATVAKYLSRYFHKYIVITDEQEFIKYIDKVIENGIWSIDTETTGLDPICDQLVGICIYTPKMKGAYVPINHISYVTQLRIEEQLTEDIVARELKRVKEANVKNILFNAKFDIRFIYNQLGVKLKAYWDGYLGARLLNENEGAGNNSLKALWLKYCNKDSENKKAWSFDKLFNGICFNLVPINVAYVYGAHDAVMTFDLYEFQKQYLNRDEELCIQKGLQRVADVFHNIEIPLVEVVADMEDYGIEFDFGYALQLSKKYNQQLKEAEETFYRICEGYSKEIEDYKLKNPNCGLDEKINISSPKQLAILLYDIIGVKSPEKDNPRGTGEDILSKINIPLTKAILTYRGIKKLLSTYIDKMPNVVNPKTKRIHCSFNQYGADTGRFSSSDPNMQNIPSGNHEIRRMFKATDGYAMISSDYSQQEPKLLAHMSQDEGLINSYLEGKDIYASVASMVYHVPYEDCLEFFPDGTVNEQGKKRRKNLKAIVLGIMYSKGANSIAKDLGISKKEAQEVFDTFFEKFPKVKDFIEKSQLQAEVYGFVETNWGRKRRLPDMQLPQYEFSYVEGGNKNYDPLDFNADVTEQEVPYEVMESYTIQLDKCWSAKDKASIKKRALQEGIKIKDNGGFIAEASRQCVNSIIQGSASDMTKIAMIKIGNDKKLKELGFHLMIPVHDELIGECPIENAKKAGERLSTLMKEASTICVPAKCDVEITDRWYGEEINV